MRINNLKLCNLNASSAFLIPPFPVAKYLQSIQISDTFPALHICFGNLPQTTSYNTHRRPEHFSNRMVRYSVKRRISEVKQYVTAAAAVKIEALQTKLIILKSISMLKKRTALKCILFCSYAGCLLNQGVPTTIKVSRNSGVCFSFVSSKKELPYPF